MENKLSELLTTYANEITELHAAAELCDSTKQTWLEMVRRDENGEIEDYAAYEQELEPLADAKQEAANEFDRQELALRSKVEKICKQYHREHPDYPENLNGQFWTAVRGGK